MFERRPPAPQYRAARNGLSAHTCTHPPSAWDVLRAPSSMAVRRAAWRRLGDSARTWTLLDPPYFDSIGRRRTLCARRDAPPALAGCPAPAAAWRPCGPPCACAAIPHAIPAASPEASDRLGAPRLGLGVQRQALPPLPCCVPSCWPAGLCPILLAQAAAQTAATATHRLHRFLQATCWACASGCAPAATPASIA